MVANGGSTVNSIFIFKFFLNLPTAQPPLHLVQSCADCYLTSEHKSVRMEAVRTCAALLVPNLLPHNIFVTQFPPSSAASAQIVGEVLGKLLTVGITDPGTYVCLYK